MQKDKNQPKKLWPVLVSLVSLVLIFNLSREIIRLSGAGERIKGTQEKIEKLKLLNWQLKQENEYRKSKEFLEKEIRDNLMMVKKGETVVILPQEILEKVASQAAEKANPSQEVVLPVWRKWLALFL